MTNTGDVSGKDVVEVYVQSPYTDYDKTNGVEKPAVELVGYGKTAELAPGASETVSVTFTKDQLKAYDANGAKTYILDAGITTSPQPRTPMRLSTMCWLPRARPQPMA